MKYKLFYLFYKNEVLKLKEKKKMLNQIYISYWQKIIKKAWVI